MAIVGFRRILICAVAAAVALAACGGDEEDGGAAVSVEEPIGAPDPAGAAAPSVVKDASVEMEVSRRDLSDAAQAVVDLATSPKVGGYLVSSVIDLEDGYGSGLIVVEVPSARFEQTVVQLGTIGELTRQEMSGQDLTADAVSARRQGQKARSRIASLRARVGDAAGDGVAEPLQPRLRRARAALRSATRERAYVRAETTYAPIEVALSGRRPPPAPAKPALEQALGTAKATTLGIASGAVIAAGVVVPLGIVLLSLYLAWTTILRRLRVRWES
ncbi:MAG TPA: DUF4349 domain-containing protein [Actinomycetota bacterium]|nr:DUF4349 domain-containing protein [Actinomycetota bacterium]